MQTKTKYEEIILKELRGFPVETLPQIVSILHSIKGTIFAVKAKEIRSVKGKASGLCGIWKDKRSSDEIINDIYTHRTGFGERNIEL